MDNLPSIRIDAANMPPSKIVDILHDRIPSPAERSLNEHMRLIRKYDWNSTAEQFDERDDVLLNSRGASVNPDSEEKGVVLISSVRVVYVCQKS
jgi:hypothetical protein